MQLRFALRSAFLVLASALAARAQAPVPGLLSFQGRLSSAAGAPLVGPVALTVRIYAAPSGGAPLHEEVLNPTALAGVVHVLLGSVTPLPANLFDGSPRYLALAVNGDAEMSPRRDVTSVPYALRAKSADGLSAGASLPAAIVDATALADGAVTGSKLGASAVGASALAAGAVTSAKLAASAVGTTALANGAVNGLKIAAASIDGGHIADGTIKTPELADGQVTSAKLAAGAVGSAQIADGSVAAADLAAGAVTAGALAAGSVTAPTLALASVNAGHVVDGSLGGAEILDSSITASDLAASAVGSSEIAPDAVGASEIADGSVGNAELNLAAGLGIGTTSPQADLHVRGASSPGSLIVAPGLANSQAQLLLSENTSGSIGVLVRYDGASTNDLQVLGQASGVETGPHLSVNRDSGIVKIPGDLRAGPGATATPRAYGSVNSNGSKMGGSSNWTVQWNAAFEYYEVHVTGIDYDPNDHCIVVTPFITTELVSPQVANFSDSGAAYVMFAAQHLPGFVPPSKKVGFSFALYEF